MLNEKTNMTPNSITTKELREISRYIDTQYLFAKASADAEFLGITGPSEELYGKMSELGEGWCSLGGPVLHNGELVILMVKPRTE